MNIYVAHSSAFNYKEGLYKPIAQSNLAHQHHFILPHQAEGLNSRKVICNDTQLFIAEVSFPSTGLGIEIGYALTHNVPVICLYKQGTTPTNALHFINHQLIEYSDSKDFINQLEIIVNKSKEQ